MPLAKRWSHHPGERQSLAQIDSGTGFAAGDDFGHVALDEKYLYVAWGDMRKNPGSSASGTQRSVYFGRVPLS